MSALAGRIVAKRMKEVFRKVKKICFETNRVLSKNFIIIKPA
jgi:hypothetical protein